MTLDACGRLGDVYLLTELGYGPSKAEVEMCPDGLLLAALGVSAAANGSEVRCAAQRRLCIYSMYLWCFGVCWRSVVCKHPAG